MDAELLLNVVRCEIDLLKKWINDTKAGGWSTHLNKPMHQRMQDLQGVLLEQLEQGRVEKSEIEELKNENERLKTENKELFAAEILRKYSGIDELNWGDDEGES